MNKRIRQSYDQKFNIGMILMVIFSVIIGIFHFGVFYLFGIPILGLLIGTILVWTSGKPVKFKILLSFAPIPIVIIVFSFMIWLNKADSENFLIPVDYRGQFVIFYEENCGQAPTYENRKRIYKIPENGILITKFEKDRGYLDQNYFLLDSHGNKTRIPFFHWQDFETEKNNRRYFDSSSAKQLTKESIGVFYAYGTKTHWISKNSVSFIVADFSYYDKSEKERWNESEAFAKKAGALLNQCHQMAR